MTHYSHYVALLSLHIVHDVVLVLVLVGYMRLLRGKRAWAEGLSNDI